jgi:IclR family transcriptional regulator, acetate operon repressor
VTTAPEAAARGTLDKGLAVLQLVAERGAVAVADVGSELGLSRSSAYRLVDRLRTTGYLQESPTAGAFRLGPRVVPIGLAALNQMDIMDVAPARLVELARAAGETVNLAVPQRDEMVYVYQAEGPGAVKVTARLGTRRPVGCSALGKAYLAALEADAREERLRRLPLERLTKHSLPSVKALRAELAVTVERGYAVDEQEAELGVACVGAAIRDYTSGPVAAISIAGPAERMPEKRTTIVPLLVDAAADISSRLGYLA